MSGACFDPYVQSTIAVRSPKNPNIIVAISSPEISDRVFCVRQQIEVASPNRNRARSRTWTPKSISISRSTSLR